VSAPSGQRTTPAPGVVTGSLDPDSRAELEEERDFLLRSLDDLEAERAAGELDDGDYRVLRDGYTDRAADVLRALEEDRAVREAPDDRPPPPRWRRPVAVLVVAGLAVGAGLGVAATAGSRQPGETVTGGGPAGGTAPRLQEAASVAREDPRRALELYDEVLADDPTSVEAWAERALLLASLGVGVEEASGLLDEARRSIDEALGLDPTAPRSLFYLGLIELFTGDRPAATRAFEDALAADPPPPLRAAIEARLEQLRVPPAPAPDGEAGEDPSGPQPGGS
jgi:tetratricopeptide (TPR) repeat protein